jgi:D-alanyl-lipoteichoic acid acyltransferase DltB (MBOAT superfamily)
MTFIPKYILILLITIVIDYVAGIKIEKSSGGTKKAYLVLSIVSTCLVLFVFKYYNFFTENFNLFTSFFHLNYPIERLEIILPIGLSFHTFQSLSYVIEVYFGRQKAEKHFGIYSLYVMFYPQLVAGPIERPQNLLHQFREKHQFNYQNMTDGLKMMLWGAFKKVVVADRLALFVNEVYGNPSQYAGPQFLIATFFFAFQIYCDFSGYSEIAIGAARVMGFELMANFNRPYFSKSISEFWQRWHISLSTWFKDYLYIPMGGNRTTKLHMYFNLFFTFLVSGFWHGANWTFIIWGSLNGFYLIVSLVLEPLKRQSLQFLKLTDGVWPLKVFNIFTTFVLICISWVFFRAKTVSDSVYILGKIYSDFYALMTRIFKNTMMLNTGFVEEFLCRQSKVSLLIAVIGIAVVLLVDGMQGEDLFFGRLNKQSNFARWFYYYILVMAIILLGMFSRQEFIYFQF